MSNTKDEVATNRDRRLLGTPYGGWLTEFAELTQTKMTGVLPEEDHATAHAYLPCRHTTAHGVGGYCAGVNGPFWRREPCLQPMCGGCATTCAACGARPVSVACCAIRTNAGWVCRRCARRLRRQQLVLAMLRFLAAPLRAKPE